MASRSNLIWSVAFRGYCRLLIALGAIPGLGWALADAVRGCLPLCFRKRGARAFLGLRGQ